MDRADITSELDSLVGPELVLSPPLKLQDQHHPIVHTTSTRRVFMRKALFYGSVGTVLGYDQLTQPAHNQNELQGAPICDLRSFMQYAQSEIPGIKFDEDAPEIVRDDSQRIAPIEMADAAIDRLSQERIDELAPRVLDWINNYQVSTDRGITNEIDCNDRARTICDRLSNRVPMHLLSIWPLRPRQRLFEDWHQIPVCKIQDDLYCIFENGVATFWYGDLDSYIGEYKTYDDNKQLVPMRIIPLVGIAEFVKPKHDMFLARILMNLKHVTNEKTMKSLNLLPPSTQLARLSDMPEWSVDR